MCGGHTWTSDRRLGMDFLGPLDIFVTETPLDAATDAQRPVSRDPFNEEEDDSQLGADRAAPPATPPALPPDPPQDPGRPESPGSDDDQHEEER